MYFLTLVSNLLNKLNHYYCESELEVSLVCKDLELVFTKLDKSYDNIIKEEYKNAESLNGLKDIPKNKVFELIERIKMAEK